MSIDEIKEIAEICTILGVAGALVGHIIKYSYDQGRNEHRVAALEEAQRGLPGVTSALAALTSAVGSLEKTAERFDRALESINSRFHGRDQ